MAILLWARRRRPESHVDHQNPPQTSIESRLYTVAAERRHQRKTTDLIPKRRIAVMAVLGLVAFFLGIINVLAIYSPGWGTIIGESGVAALKIWGPGTLATWGASVCWIVSAVVCAQIFVLRRHRNDDYEGTYRVWGWLALFSLFASALCNVDILGILFHVASWLTQVSLFEPSWLIPAAISVMVGLVVVRALFEVRCSYGTVAWYTMAWVAWSISTVASVKGSPDLASSAWLGLSAELIVGNGLLLASVFAMLGKLNYARYVFLRANGLVKVQPAVSSEAIDQENESQATAAPPKRKRSTRTKSSSTKTASTKTASAKSTSARRKSSKPKTAATKPADKEEQVVEQEATKPQPKAVPLQVVSATDEVETSSESPSVATISASEKLRQLAEASRARQQAQSSSTDDSQSDASGSRLGQQKVDQGRKATFEKSSKKSQTCGLAWLAKKCVFDGLNTSTTRKFEVAVFFLLQARKRGNSLLRQVEFPRFRFGLVSSAHLNQLTRRTR